MTEKLDKFTSAYIEAAMWTSTDDEDRPLDKSYSITDLASEAIVIAVRDCAAFQKLHLQNTERDPERAGHGNLHPVSTTPSRQPTIALTVVQQRLMAYALVHLLANYDEQMEEDLEMTEDEARKEAVATGIIQEV